MQETIKNINIDLLIPFKIIRLRKETELKRRIDREHKRKRIA